MVNRRFIALWIYIDRGQNPTMVLWPPYPWYIDPHIHGILTPLSMVYRPPYLGILTPTHRSVTPISVVFCPLTHAILHYPLYFDTPTYFILNSLLSYYEPQSFGKTEGVSLPWEGSIYIDNNRPRGQYCIWKLTRGSIYHGGQNTLSDVLVASIILIDWKGTF